MRYPATYGSYGGVTAFVVPDVLSGFVVGGVPVAGMGRVVSALVARHQRALQADWQKRRRGSSARPLPPWRRELVVPAHVTIELRDRECSATVAGRVDEPLFDEPRPRRSKLVGAAAQHGGHVLQVP